MPKPFVKDSRVIGTFQNGTSDQFIQLNFGLYESLDCSYPPSKLLLPLIDKPYFLHSIRQYQDVQFVRLSPSIGFSSLVAFPNQIFHGLTNNDIISLYSEMADKMSGHDFDAGVFLGEGRMTVDLVFQTATRIAKCFTAIRHGNLSMAKDVLLDNNRILPVDFMSNKNIKRYFQKEMGLNPFTNDRVRRSSKAIAQGVLELRYGWQPLLSDVHSAMSALSNRLNKTFITRVRHTAVRHDVTATDSFTCSLMHRIKLTGSILSHPPLNTYLNLTDPLNVAWNLSPYSFVLDWFIPIGDFLSLAGKLRSHEYGPMTRSEVYEDVRSAKGQGDSRSWLIDYSFTRDPSFIFPSVPPLPEFKNLGDALSPTHVENALALLRVLHK